jgi:hypothetical protein
MTRLPGTFFPVGATGFEPATSCSLRSVLSAFQILRRFRHRLDPILEASLAYEVPERSLEIIVTDA